MNTMQHVLIFGATSAIATAVARRLAADGCWLFCVGRNEARLQVLMDDLRVISGRTEQIAGTHADLRKTDDHQALIQAALAHLGRLDAVLICHGSLPDQRECESSWERCLAEIDTNALSVISLVTHLANHLESQGSGVLGVITSVAGDRGRASNYVYGAAKGMVDIFLEGVTARLAPKGVTVVTLKPGFVDTPMTAGLNKGGPLWSKPDAVGREILNAMKKGKRKAYIPRIWYWIMLVIRLLPFTLFRRLKL